MPWYDTNLNPIDNPPNDETCFHIQKPHTRTVPFFCNKKLLYKQIEFPWTVFACMQQKDDAFFAVSKEMPTKNSKLYRMETLGMCGFVCLEYFNSYYDENNATPQDYLDYFWSSAFTPYTPLEIDPIKLIPIKNININYLVNVKD